MLLILYPQTSCQQGRWWCERKASVGVHEDCVVVFSLLPFRKFLLLLFSTSTRICPFWRRSRDHSERVSLFWTAGADIVAISLHFSRRGRRRQPMACCWVCFWRKRAGHGFPVPMFWKMIGGECDEEEKNSRCERWIYIPSAKMGRSAHIRRYTHGMRKSSERRLICSFDWPLPYIPTISLA